MTFWPKSQAQRDSVAEKIADLLGVQFVAVFYEGIEKQESQGSYDGRRGDEGVGLAFSDKIQQEGVNRVGVAAFLKEELRFLAQRETLSEGQTIGKETTLKSELVKLPKIPLQFLYHVLHRFESGCLDGRIFAIVAGSTESLSREQQILTQSLVETLVLLGRIKDLQSALDIRNQFLSIASHELKTPLTSIYGILQLQERTLRIQGSPAPFPDQERQHSFLKMVIRQVERLNELIDGLLDVSRIQNGRFTIDPTETDVAALLDESINSRMAVFAKDAGVKINVNSVPTLLAWVDPVRMEEVINNLIMNAIRFSPEGGVIWVKLKSEEGALRLTVRDQGPDIPMVDRERIFQPFERAQRTARMGGLGLGLYISRQIALLHGGNVSLIESISGKGNLFEAYFPCKTEHAGR